MIVAQFDLITLHSVYDEEGQPRVEAVDFLYELLRERTPEQSISHRKMPTLREHTAFILKRPYKAFYIVGTGGHGQLNEPLRPTPVGSVYLTHQREIGIFIEERWRGRGYGPAAVQAIMRQHPGDRFLWNVNPENVPSIRTVEKLGGRLISHTYEL